MLDQFQMNIINSNKNNIFIKAGAGSGKTRVIITKINKLLNEGVKDDEILAITFTNKACGEMKERLEGRLSNIYTFHGYCYKLLTNLGKEINLVEEQASSGELLSISKYKNSLFKKIKPLSYNKYQNKLKENNQMDFDDLIIESLNLVGDHQFKYIFIDEFQDINNLQYELLKRMKKPNTNFWAVGDLNQSIYQFRGANNKLIFKYIKEYEATTFELNNNYRCGVKIVRLANLLINKNYIFNKVKYVSLSNKEDKISVIIEKNNYTNHIYNELRLASLKYLKVAVLFRYHYESYELIKLVRNSYMQNVSFYSFHETKGLEFDCVFIINASSIPSLKSYQHRTLKEEIRIFYVAITRAKERLYIYSKKNTKLLTKLVKDYYRSII